MDKRTAIKLSYKKYANVLNINSLNFFISGIILLLI